MSAKHCSGAEHIGKGLEVARDFFINWGLPYLQEHQGHLVDRVAAILCLGSDSLGNDDELSRDHNWGPRFTLVLTGEDKRRYGRKLQREIDLAAPRKWRGYEFRYTQRSVTVESLNQYLRRILGVDQPPQTAQGWRRTREENLYMVRHATVFHDPLGAFSRRRQAFWSYPEARRLERIWEELWKVWHFGEYNFLERLCHRRDPIANAVCIGQFTEAVMRLAMLLDGDYTPYWKWLAAEFRKVQGVEAVAEKLSGLCSTSSVQQQVVFVQAVCRDVHRRLVEQLDLNANPQGHPHRLHLAAVELKNRAERKTESA